MAGLIESYVRDLKRDLHFDPALAERIAGEVESHLWEAAEAEPGYPSADAERRAIERFGVAREIASRFAADAMARQSRRTWIALLVTTGVTFIAMRLRVLWLGETGDTLSTLLPVIDRYGFVAAIATGMVGWFAFRRSFFPLAICLSALVASITAGIVRAGLFADGAPLHVLLTAAGEIALAGVLAFHVCTLGRGLWRTALLRRIGQ